jgi:hypothetical protein
VPKSLLETPLSPVLPTPESAFSSSSIMMMHGAIASAIRNA